MGKCVFCGRPAGLFKTQHIECLDRSLQQQQAPPQTEIPFDQLSPEEQARRRQKLFEDARHDPFLNNELGKAILVEDAMRVAKGEADLGLLDGRIPGLALQHGLSPIDIHNVLIIAWNGAAVAALEDRILTEEEERHLDLFREHFSLSIDDCNRLGGGVTLLSRAAVIRDVSRGVFKMRPGFAPPPYAVKKDETLLWNFCDTQFCEERTRTQYVGGSHGASFRIARGMYYRVSAFKGQPVTTTSLELVDVGHFGVTDKGLYFAGARKAFTVPLTEVLALQPYTDAVGVQRDGANAKPMVFLNGEGWFSYNLLANLVGIHLDGNWLGNPQA